MKELHRNIVPKVIVLLMNLIISLVVINKALFIHSHVLKNGYIITHAHPFHKSEDPANGNTHHHSSNDYQLICSLDPDLLSNLIINNFSAYTFSAFYHFQLIQSYTPQPASLFLKRGPPSF